MITTFARASLAFFLATGVLALALIALAPIPEVQMFGLIALGTSGVGFALNAIALGHEFLAIVAAVFAGPKQRARQLRASAAQARQRQRNADAMNASPV